SQRPQLAGVVQRASAAAIEHIAAILARNGQIAPQGKIGSCIVRHHGLASLFAPDAWWKENLSCGAEKIGNTVKSLAQRMEESRFHDHVVVQKTNVRISSASNAAVYGAREGERLGADFDDRLWEAVGRAVARAVIDDDDFRGNCLQLALHARKRCFQQVL